MDYSTVFVDWKNPAGSWDSLRLVRNRYGWAVDETDGEILYEVSHAASSFADTGTVGGHWLYYTIFINVGGEWSRAGTTSTLMPKDNSYTDLLYSLVPTYYKVDVASGNSTTDDSNTVNPFLKPFLSVFGFGFDLVKSFYDSNRYTNDAMRTHYGNIQQMAGQFGVDYEASTPAFLFRQRIRDAAVLGRQKGTLEQLRSVIAETTGYDTVLSLSANQMLSDDQAAFLHPRYAQWDVAANYAAGERIRFGTFIYQANTGGAYGQAQQPTGTSSSNAFWTPVTGTYDATLLDTNGRIAGWEEVSYTVGVTPGTGAVQGGVGVQRPTDTTDQSGNALVVRNNSSGGATATMGVRSVGKLAGQSTMDPAQPVLWGIPLPATQQSWDASAFYEPGDTVTYHGRTYQAIGGVQGVHPPLNAVVGGTGYGAGPYGAGPYGGNALWAPLGYDNRVQMCLSGFTQGVSGQAVPVYPFVEYYDSHGALITGLYTDAPPAYTVFDSFTQNWIPWVARTTDIGGLTWVESVGQWASGGYGGGSAFPVSTGRAFASLSGHADGMVSATFVTSAPGTLKQGVLFRIQDTSNYWRADRDALRRISTGTVAATSPYSQTLLDGDRITVAYSGANIAVQRNGVQVLSISDANLVTATGVGMAVE